MKKWWYRRILIILVVLSSVMGTGYGMDRIQAEEERHQVSGTARGSQMLIPGGVPIGIYMETDGVLVLATDSIECLDGSMSEPAKNLVKAGDYIVGFNGEKIEDKKELISAIHQLKSAKVVLTIRRNEEEIDVKIHCAEVRREQYKLGIWVKDNVQGLGTLTYLTADGHFGALGHGIHDSDTDELLEMDEGSVYKTRVIGIQKGVKGEPGGLEGIITYSKYNRVGYIELNTENGIFGTISNVDAVTENQEALEICKKNDIKLGKATILCTVDGTCKEYNIKIKNVDNYTADVNKGIIIEIIDEELLKLTGGIVQGMSGSPILQNGKIVGAVTHVLVNDPARGYGIFIEDMLDEAA